jgi:anti-anti-sigma factor
MLNVGLDEQPPMSAGFVGPGTDPGGVMSADSPSFASAPMARVVVCHTADGLCITLSGDFDVTNAVDIRCQLLEAVQRCEGRVVVNLAGVTFISVAGVRALAAVGAWCSGQDRAIHLVNVSGVPRRVMVLCGLGGMLT